MAFEINLYNVRSITKSDRAIQIKPTTYCNISPISEIEFLLLLCFLKQIAFSVHLLY